MQPDNSIYSLCIMLTFRDERSSYLEESLSTLTSISFFVINFFMFPVIQAVLYHNITELTEINNNPLCLMHEIYFPMLFSYQLS